MSNSWQPVRMKEVCDITSSKRIYAADYQTKGIPFYRGKEIIEKQKGLLDISTELYISDEKYNTIRRKFGVLQSRDLLLTSVGTLGIPYVIKQNEEFYFKDGNLTWFRDFRNLDSRYLYYWLLSAQGRAQLKKCTIGSSQPALTIVLLKDMEIELPPHPIQSKIAAILTAYDDLIENNNRRIKILEKMARLVYQEWFVNFRFPGHENVNLVDSPMGKMPEGWECGTLEDILVQLESGSRPKGGAAVNEEGIPSIGAENILGLGIYDYSKEKYVSLDYYNSMRRGHVESGDVLIYKDGANIGRKSLFRDSFPHVTCCINEHVFILRSNDRITQNYLFFWLDLPYMTQMIRNLNANAAQPGINQGGIKGLPILIPTREVLNTFQTVVEPLCALLFNLAKRNRILQIARDRLLPKLISGEIDVSELDITIAEEAA